MSGSLTDSLISRKRTALSPLQIAPTGATDRRQIGSFTSRPVNVGFPTFLRTRFHSDFVVQKPDARSILLWTPERISRMALRRFSGESEKWRRFGELRWQSFSFSRLPCHQGMSTAVRQRINLNRKINLKRRINPRRINPKRRVRVHQKINLGTPIRVHQRRERRRKTSRTSGDSVNDTWPKHELRQSIHGKPPIKPTAPAAKSRRQRRTT